MIVFLHILMEKTDEAGRPFPLAKAENGHKNTAEKKILR